MLTTHHLSNPCGHLIPLCSRGETQSDTLDQKTTCTQDSKVSFAKSGMGLGPMARFCCYCIPYYRRERNAYAKQLLMMLKSGKLKEPFTLSPPLGPLRPRPPGLLHVGGETETLMSSSPPNTFLKSPKSVSSRPSSLLSTHRPGGGPHQFSPLRPISPQDPVSSSSSANKTTARQLEEDENLFSLPEEISCPIVATAPRGGGSDLSSSPLEWKFHPSLTSSVKVTYIVTLDLAATCDVMYVACIVG